MLTVFLASIRGLFSEYYYVDTMTYLCFRQSVGNWELSSGLVEVTVVSIP